MKKYFNTKKIMTLMMSGVLMGSTLLTGCTGNRGVNIMNSYSGDEEKREEIATWQIPGYKEEEPKEYAGVETLGTATHSESALYPDYEEYMKNYGDKGDKQYYNAMEEWGKDREKRLEGSEVNAPAIEAFSEKLLPTMMKEGENTVVSPINIYLAFAMLAEVSGGDTQKEVLDALGCESIEELQEIAKQLIRTNDFEDGSVTSRIANSLWLRNDKNFTYDRKTIDDIASKYLAETYSGEMGSEEMNSALQQWLNDNTGGLLEQQASGVKTDPATILALASTIYFKAAWSDGFADAGKDAFYGFAGEQECNMMNRVENNYYYVGEDFTAVNIDIQNGGSMWVLMPAEGVKPEELLENDKAKKIIYENSVQDVERGRVDLTLPKFDVNSDIDLKETMVKLGITSAFNSETADFSNLIKNEDAEAAISSAKHAARVCADEDGVLAAAFTVMMLDGCAAMPEDPLLIKIDRPFLFTILGDDGSLLFTGTVYEPGNN